jgi:hypothetical protein
MTFEVVLADLLRQVQLQTDAVDQAELCLEEVDVLFGLGEDRGEQFAGAVVANLGAELDRLVVGIDALLFEGQVVFELRLDVVADANDIIAGDFGDAFEEQDPVDDLFGVPHFTDRFDVVLLAELGVAPVVVHLGLDEVLVDGREFDGQRGVERVDDLGVAFHCDSPKSVCSVNWKCLHLSVDDFAELYRAARALGMENARKVAIFAGIYRISTRSQHVATLSLNKLAAGRWSLSRRPLKKKKAALHRARLLCCSQGRKTLDAMANDKDPRSYDLGYKIPYRCTRADPPLASCSTSGSFAIVVSPGNVVSNAP